MHCIAINVFFDCPKRNSLLRKTHQCERGLTNFYPVFLIVEAHPVVVVVVAAACAVAAKFKFKTSWLF